MRSHLLPHLSRIAVVAAALLLLAPVARADAPSEPLRFLLETITIERAETVSPDILLTESRLVEGRAYSEAQLRDAIHRIVRLPLVLDAKPELRKGSAPGSYQLVIEVIETRRWFFGLDLDATRWSEPISVDGLRTTRHSGSTVATVGRRFSVGRNGIFFAALGGEDGTVQAGYTHYDLFGHGGLLAVSLGVSDCGTGLELGTEGGIITGGFEPNEPVQDGCATTIFDLGLDPTYSSWSQLSDRRQARLHLVLPLVGNQSLRLTALRSDSDEGLRRRALEPSALLFWRYQDLEEWRVDAGWALNSVDDPTFPTEGRVVEIGLELQTLEADLTPTSRSLVARRDPRRARSRQLGLELSAAQYWPVGQRAAISVHARALVGRASLRGFPIEGVAGGLPILQPGQIDEDLDVVSGAVTVGHGHLLRQSRSQRHWRQLWWESQLEGFYSATSPDFGESANPQRGFRVATGLAYRTPWGLLRFTLNYQSVTGA